MTFYLIKGSTGLKQIWTNAYKAALEIYASGGCTVALTPYKKNKTRQQEKYWHSCLQIIAKETGNDMEDLKIEVKIACGFKRVKEINGQVVTIAMSSTKLKVDEYGVLINATKVLAQNLGIRLPDPEYFGMR